MRSCSALKYATLGDRQKRLNTYREPPEPLPFIFYTPKLLKFLNLHKCRMASVYFGRPFVCFASEKAA